MIASSARYEWRANWPLVLAVMAGISFASVAANPKWDEKHEAA